MSNRRPLAKPAAAKAGRPLQGPTAGSPGRAHVPMVPPAPNPKGGETPPPPPDVQLPAIVEIGITGGEGNAFLCTKPGEALVQILVQEPGAPIVPAGWDAIPASEIGYQQPFVLSPDMILAVGRRGYCRLNSGWGSDPKKSPLALIEGIELPMSKRPEWVETADWEEWPPEVVRVVHPLCPPVLHTRKHIVEGGGVVEELFTASSVVQILR